MKKQNKSFSCINLGCRVNLFETTTIIDQMIKNGFVFNKDFKKTDICIINTCTVTARADRKCRNMISRARKYAKVLVIIGCYSQINAEYASYYGDIVLGTGNVVEGVWTVSNIDTKLVDPSSNAYTITAYYGSNVNYNSASETSSLTVNKFTPDISIESTTVWFNQTNGGVLSGRVYTYSGDFYAGLIDLYVNGKLIACDVSVAGDGRWNYALSSTVDLTPGVYSVRVDWKGNAYTNVNSVSEDRYSVNKGMVIPIVSTTGNIDIGRSEYVYVDVNNVMGGGYLGGLTVTLQGSGIDGVLQNLSNSDGKAVFIVPDLAAGRYNDWKVSIVSNDYYSPTADSFNVAGFYVQYPLTVNITSVSPTNSIYPEEIIVKGFTDADDVPRGNVSLTIGGRSYVGFFDDKGNFTAILVGVKPGVYNNITAKYNPTADEFYYRGVEADVSVPETGV